MNVFGGKEIQKVYFLDITKTSTQEYEADKTNIVLNSNQYKFKIGESVNWNYRKVNYSCKIIELNETTHKATLEYTDNEGETQQKSASYLDIKKAP